MKRLSTLVTCQWADLPLADLAVQAREFGFEGLELAAWGDHFEVDRILAERGPVGRLDLHWYLRPSVDNAGWRNSLTAGLYAGIAVHRQWPGWVIQAYGLGAFFLRRVA